MQSGEGEVWVCIGGKDLLGGVEGGEGGEEEDWWYGLLGTSLSRGGGVEEGVEGGDIHVCSGGVA